MHYAGDCQHNENENAGNDDGVIPTMLTVEVTNDNDNEPEESGDLFQLIDSTTSTDVEEEYVPSLFSDNINEKYKDCFTGEALHSAILDSGCRKSVCGVLWYERAFWRHFQMTFSAR